MKEFTEKEKKKIVEEALDGATIQDLADLHNCTELDIEDLCKKDPEVGRLVRAAKAELRMFIRKRLKEVCSASDPRSAYFALGQLSRIYLREETTKKKGRPRSGEDIDLDDLSDEDLEKMLSESDSKFAEYVAEMRAKG